MVLVRDPHCASCGAAYTPPFTWPRTCPACGAQRWANPIPVSVVLVPVHVDDRLGLLVVRRAIEPRAGLLAIVGGFLEEHETWQQGGAREVREETGVLVDADRLMPFWFTSSQPTPNRVLLFSLAPAMRADELPPFARNDEVSERGVVLGPDGLDDGFAFPLHAEAARRWFSSSGSAGKAEFVRV